MTPKVTSEANCVMNQSEVNEAGNRAREGINTLPSIPSCDKKFEYSVV